jgi:hypothetical protein
MSQDRVAIPKDRLYAWHTAAKSLVLFPGMEAKVGKDVYQDLCRTVLDLEAVMGADPPAQAAPEAAKAAKPRFTIAK